MRLHNIIVLKCDTNILNLMKEETIRLVNGPKDITLTKRIESRGKILLLVSFKSMSYNQS